MKLQEREFLDFWWYRDSDKEQWKRTAWGRLWAMFESAALELRLSHSSVDARFALDTEGSEEVSPQHV